MANNNPNVKQALVQHDRVKNLQILFFVITLALCATIFIVITLKWQHNQHKSYGLTNNNQSNIGKAAGKDVSIIGYNRNSRLYKISAQKATTHTNNKDDITLEHIVTKFESASNSWVNITSSNGYYKKSEDIIEFYKDVNLTTTDNITGYLRSAILDVKNETLKSKTPVEIYLSNGKIIANSMDIKDGGNTIIFYGNVKMHFNSL